MDTYLLTFATLSNKVFYYWSTWIDYDRN